MQNLQSATEALILKIKIMTAKKYNLGFSFAKKSGYRFAAPLLDLYPIFAQAPSTPWPTLTSDAMNGSTTATVVF